MFLPNGESCWSSLDIDGIFRVSPTLRSPREGESVVRLRSGLLRFPHTGYDAVGSKYCPPSHSNPWSTDIELESRGLTMLSMSSLCI